MPQIILPAGPQRTMSVVTFINTTGNGVYLTAGVLYFTRVLALPASQVGLGLSIAGLAALGVGIPVGHLADRRGPRGVYAATLICGALTMAGFLLVRGFWAFVGVACIGAATQAAGPAVRGPLIRRYGGDRPAAFRAYLRSVTNAGVSVGAVLAGWAVQADTRTAYLLLIAGNGLSFLAAAAVLTRLPAVAPQRRSEGPRWIALRDRPYLALTLLDGVMAIQYRVLTVAVPLWLVDATSAPRWLVSATMLTNTTLVVSLQVHMSKNVDTPLAGGNALRRAGMAFFASSGTIALASGEPVWAAITLMLAGVCVHTLGEVWHAAGSFEISFALAPAHAQGQYLGVFGIGLGMGEAIGPALLTALCLGWGRPGWFAVGTLLALTGLLAPALVRWAERRSLSSAAA